MSNKLNQKFKVTPELQKRIQELAIEMPPVGKMLNGQPVYKATIVMGTDVTKEDLKPGTPIIPEAHYKINRLVYEDHAFNMVKLVKRDGPQAIEEYCAAIKAQQDAFRREVKEQKSVSNKFFNFLYKHTKWLRKTH